MSAPGRMPPLKSAAVLLHPMKAEAGAVADAACAALDDCTLVVSRGSVWDAAFLREVLPRVDVAITLGGDGSILRASRIAALTGTPVLGINLGTLGFLAEMEPDEVAERLPPLAAGHYWIEERMMLQIEHRRDGEQLGTYQALNEAAVGSQTLSRVVRVTVHLDGQELTTYTGDGVLVATPTGSTAYSHAAGGPILHPEVRSLVLTPVCAHPRTSGALVIPSDTAVTMVVHTDHGAALSIDGQDEILMRDGDTVIVGASPYSARFLRRQERDYFYRTLLRKLRL
ncbi:MAG TPA: NAD(+)/NADH kinase [Chloroflexota bacterium]|nr:NAD(+)/NADH kinase [Chloroflexota bacterium]